MTQMRQDCLSSTLVVFLVHPFRASVTDTSVRLSSRRVVDPLIHPFNSLYALTLGNKRTVVFFSAITLTQFLMGMYMVGIAAREPGMCDEHCDYRRR